MIVLYRKNAFSALACWWYPAAFFHALRPISCTRLMVWSRGLARARGLREAVAVVDGGTTGTGSGQNTLIDLPVLVDDWQGQVAHVVAGILETGRHVKSLETSPVTVEGFSNYLPEIF